MSEINLDTLFIKATNDVKNLKNLDNTILLILYGNFKQATIGNCNLSAPSIFNIKDTAKYNSWKKLSKVSKASAKINYIKLVRELIELKLK